MRILVDRATNEILQVEKVPSEATFCLGKLCIRGHEYEDTGQTLRYINRKKGCSGPCVECSKLKATRQSQDQTRARREARVLARQSDLDLLKAHGIDTATYRLGKLCRNRHNFQGTGKTLRRHAGDCVECSKDRVSSWRDSLTEEQRGDLQAYFTRRSRERYASDEQYMMSCRLRSRFRNAMRAYTRTGKVKTSKEYGISYAAILAHLGPCPGAREAWHIDHVRPLRSFDLSDSEQVRKAMCPENFQWLPAKVNLAKKDRAWA